MTAHGLSRAGTEEAHPIQAVLTAFEWVRSFKGVFGLEGVRVKFLCVTAKQQGLALERIILPSDMGTPSNLILRQLLNIAVSGVLLLGFVLLRLHAHKS